MPTTADQQASTLPGAAAAVEPLYRNQYRCQVEDQSNYRSYAVMILIFVLAGVAVYLAINLCKPLFQKRTP